MLEQSSPSQSAIAPTAVTRHPTKPLVKQVRTSLNARWGNRSSWKFFSIICLALFLIGAVGCRQLRYRLDRRPPKQFVPNPLELPAMQDTYLWQQVVDTVDDYFRIATEQPVQNSNQYMLDGRLETSYQIGGSIGELWRKDSTAGFEVRESTLQTIRRKATVIVRPSEAGYLVEVIVQKDLENTDGTQFSTETAITRRNDGSMVRQNAADQNLPQTIGWIAQGRDTSLEQRILRDIFARATAPTR
ncbi:hypothetical protein SV7mr_35290 [Stieleria bergensis]|uniref:Uncharacterized protein n=2 Tax=Stieleria bergensis TaxID=2528025 RepID=A0A517SXY2_9BACT|nr:hypothetical protein SV7mr_35290 [Planctomycetes bacterium SV_7m_r]